MINNQENPPPSSGYTLTIIGSRVFLFGGIVPSRYVEEGEKEIMPTNEMYFLDLNFPPESQRYVAKWTHVHFKDTMVGNSNEIQFCSSYTSQLHSSTSNAETDKCDENHKPFSGGDSKQFIKETFLRPTGRWRHTTTPSIRPTEMVTFGGYSSDSFHRLNDVWVFNVVTMQWRLIQRTSPVIDDGNHLRHDWDCDDENKNFNSDNYTTKSKVGTDKIRPSPRGGHATGKVNMHTYSKNQYDTPSTAVMISR
mmetsp:Transcript_15238/g.21732  ORF Transcript_15238/g.21732 Transcript_15238/m.21732 type:complete len:251 (-) Transcript_15238:3642-4394(-)